MNIQKQDNIIVKNHQRKEFKWRIKYLFYRHLNICQASISVSEFV